MVKNGGKNAGKKVHEGVKNKWCKPSREVADGLRNMAKLMLIRNKRRRRK